MAYKVDGEIKELVIAFQEKRLAKADWTHQAHLTVAFWYIFKYSFNEALEHIRFAIKEYNEAVGTPNTPISGYHETLTCFWMQVLANYKNKYPELSLLALCNSFFVSKYAHKELPLTCLPIERLLSPKARLKLDVRIFEGAWKELFDTEERS